MFDSLPKVPRVLVLYHGGEPLLNKDLEYMILYAKSKGVQKTVFNSNVALLTEKRGITLGMAGLDEMRVSFDGESPEQNDTIRVNSHFNQHAPIVRKVAEGKIRPKKIVIYNARFGTTEPAPYLREFFKDSPVDFRGEKIRTWARDKNAPDPSGEVDFCSNLFETFTMLSDGSVVMCCEDLMADEIVGNVNEESPLAIWERMEERRQAFAEKNYPKLCQSCWVVTGKFMAPTLERA
jgi:radical SAM protein with 4Fe4S-binding SPASM domain